MRSEDQFNPLAAKYAASPVHASGPSLPVLLEIAAPLSTELALDIATGTGHTALTLAPHVGHVIGLDRAEKMLEQARRLSEERGYTNTEFVVGDAEAVPYPDAHFDLVTARHAPHHFLNADRFLAEVRRVLKPSGRFVMVDQISPTESDYAWIHAWEQTRDRSHFSQRTPEQWSELASAAGLSSELKSVVPYRMEFDWWTRQSGCSEEQVAFLVAHAQSAPDLVREAIRLEFDAENRPFAFTSPMGVFLMRPL